MSKSSDLNPKMPQYQGILFLQISGSMHVILPPMMPPKLPPGMPPYIALSMPSVPTNVPPSVLSNHIKHKLRVCVGAHTRHDTRAH